MSSTFGGRSSVFRIGRVAATLASLVVVAGCQSPSAPREITVAAASDLQFALDDILNEFRTARPDLQPRVSYGSSGNFFAQISRGAPFDVFLSADVEYITRLEVERLTRPEGRFVYAVGRIVLWALNTVPFDVTRGPDVLKSPLVRKIAIANPRHAPYGEAAAAALRSLGLYDEVESKLVFGENVAQAAQFVEGGAADVGIIALSLALSPTLLKEGRYWEVPLDAYPRMEQGGAILKMTRDPEAARALTAFMVGSRGRAVLKRFGFFLPSD